MEALLPCALTLLALVTHLYFVLRAILELLQGPAATCRLESRGVRPPLRKRSPQLQSAGEPQETMGEDCWREAIRHHFRRSGPLREALPLSSDNSLTDIVALDAEMVGTGHRGLDSTLAAVCVVNGHGNVVYETLVRPGVKVVDYRTEFSGMTKELLDGPDDVVRDFREVRQHVLALLQGRIVVGHGLENDFLALKIDDKNLCVRDTAHDLPRLKNGSRPRKLKHLAAEHLHLRIQRGGSPHDAATDARAALYLYLKFQGEFEARMAKRRSGPASRR